MDVQLGHVGKELESNKDPELGHLLIALELPVKGGEQK